MRTYSIRCAQKWSESVHIYGSCRKIKTGVPLCLEHSEQHCVCAGCARKVTTNDEGRPYNTGQWHEVTVRRRGVNGTLEVTGIAGGCLSPNYHFQCSLSYQFFTVCKI